MTYSNTTTGCTSNIKFHSWYGLIMCNRNVQANWNTLQPMMVGMLVLENKIFLRLTIQGVMMIVLIRRLLVLLRSSTIVLLFCSEIWVPWSSMTISYNALIFSTCSLPSRIVVYIPSVIAVLLIIWWTPRWSRILVLLWGSTPILTAFSGSTTTVRLS